MKNEKTISIAELARFGSVNNFNRQALAMVVQQKATLELAGNNYKALSRVQIRTFDFGHFKILTQFNPERIRSSAAKTDAKSIANRPCFLCTENLPSEQQGIFFENKYLVLINPYPIFPVHLTVPHTNHTPQRIEKYFGDMLELSQELFDFTVFYNGPQCGASAPDHFHFQAVGKNSLPVENELGMLEETQLELIFQNENTKIVAVENYLRRFIAIVSKDKNEVQKRFELIYNNLESKPGDEPMLNILCNFKDGEWRVIIFPREKQRPSHFFRNDETKLIVSPAAVELGGIIVLPREEDFSKITKKEIEEIYKEVTINLTAFKKLITILKA